MDTNYLLERKCWRKRAYSTSREAQQEIKRAYRTYHRRLYKYVCSTCNNYHLTKQLAAKGKII